ncbi:MAG: hypothetical protein LCH47_07690 [Proteobacteria bacterium]|nr:hypothetical protein [Pseudomonadota bacterium]
MSPITPRPKMRLLEKKMGTSRKINQSTLRGDGEGAFDIRDTGNVNLENRPTGCRTPQGKGSDKFTSTPEMKKPMTLRPPAFHKGGDPGEPEPRSAD